MTNEFVPEPEMDQATSDLWQKGIDDFLKKDGIFKPEKKRIPRRVEVGVNLTDLGNARRFISEHGRDIRYCYPWGKWLLWNGRHWHEDTLGEIYRRGKDVIRLILKEASNETDDKRRRELEFFSLRCESQSKLWAMIKLAESETPILPEEFNRDPWLLNLQNGTLNLSTGTLKAHDRDDLISKKSPVEYDPEATCPGWLEHLNKIMAGSQEKIGFLKRFYGYCLTGITDERVLMLQ